MRENSQFRSAGHIEKSLCGLKIRPVIQQPFRVVSWKSVCSWVALTTVDLCLSASQSAENIELESYVVTAENIFIS